MKNSIRFKVFERDRFTCQYCGKRVPDIILEADHLLPKSQGGKDTLDNLVTSCFECNRGKAARILINNPNIEYNAPSEAERKERREQLSSYIAWLKEEQENINQQIRYIYKVWADNFSNPIYPNENSVRLFLKSIGLANILEAISITASKNVLSALPYFYGVCHKMRRDSQEGIE